MRRIDSPLGPLRVAVLAGGDSAERLVSLESGAAVAEALRSRGHRVVVIDPAGIPLADIAWQEHDVAFLALHGRFGEDGQVQTLLEQIGIPYTGSGPATSKLAFSKSASKERFAQFGVPTLPYVLFHASEDRERIAAHAATLGYPLVVKPDAEGSSLGVSIVREPAELPTALTTCFEYGAFGVLEPYVAGSEWTVGFLDDLLLPVIRITTLRAFYDYQAKYHDDSTQYDFDPDVPAETIASIAESGRRAGEALGTRGLARVDLMLDQDQRPWVLEVNTIPGFTSHSLVPKAAARLGISFPELCERALQSCLSRTSQREVRGRSERSARVVGGGLP